MILASLVAFNIHYWFWYSLLGQYQDGNEAYLMLKFRLDSEKARDYTNLIKNPLFFGWGQLPLWERAVAGMFYIIEILLYLTCIFQIYGEYSVSMLGIFIGVTTIPMLVLLAIKMVGLVEEKLNKKGEGGI